MRSLIEAFTTVLIAGIMVLLCGSFIWIQLETNNAKDLHSTYVSMIETSDFDTETINQCKTDAADKGYTLEVTDNSALKKKCATCNKILDPSTPTCSGCGGSKVFDYYEDRECVVKLTYTLDVPVIGLEREGVVNGYAR